MFNLCHKLRYKLANDFSLAARVHVSSDPTVELYTKLLILKKMYKFTSKKTGNELQFQLTTI